jgi:hypothetical protein
VTVSGYVREAATGRPITGAPVDVFMNESKRAPGVLVGQGASDARGVFTIKLSLPNDKPAREYQLVNHAVAFVDGTGHAYGDGWGDPPFTTVASTTLTMSLPARDGLGAATNINGTLVDKTGPGVSSATVVVYVDNTVVSRPVTDSAGRWQIQYTFPSGSHAVEARFAGTSYYDPSNIARATISIDDYAIEIAPTLRAKPGEGLQLSGRVLGKGAAAPDRLVTIDGPFGNPTVSLRSDAAGRFSYSFSTSASQPPGTYVLTYRLPDHNVTKTQRVELNITGRIALSAPDTWDVEVPLPVAITLQTSAGVPLAGQSVRLSLAGPGGARDITVVTDAAGGAAPDLAPLRATAGSYTISARVLNAPNLEAPAVTQSLNLGTFDIRWSLPQTAQRGAPLFGNTTVSFGGRPFAGQTVTIDAFGSQQVTTDSQGVARWRAAVPTVAKPGTHSLTLQALDHPMRNASIDVVSIPKLTFDAPDVMEAGVPPQASLTLTDDQGDPIRNSAITITAVSGGGVNRTVVTTDARGHWSGPVNVSASEGSNVTLSARFDRSGSFLAAEGVQTMSVVAPTTRATSPNLWPLVALSAIVVAGGGCTTWWWLARRRTHRVPVIETAASAALAATAPRPGELDIHFAIPPGEPSVWGMGDPIELIAHNNGVAGSFELAWPGGSSVIALGESTEARTALTFPQEGDITLSAQRQGGSFTPNATSLRIVDYRKETAREFDLFLDKARTLDASLTRRSTPREIVWTLAGRLGAESEPLLDEVALVMEVTNYSQYEVKREHYLRFVAAARRLDGFFTPAAPLPQGG